MSVVDPDLGRKSEEVPFLFRLGSPCKRELFSAFTVFSVLNFIFIYLFACLAWLLGSSLPDQGLNLGPRQ